MSLKPHFKPEVKSDFSAVLRKRVNDYFDEHQLSKKATMGMYVRAFVLITLWISTYTALMLVQPTLQVAYVLWIVLGFLIPLVTVNIGHDAIHGAFTEKKWLKNLLSQTFNLNGASAYMWKISHNHAHHNYTNMHDHDEDINPGIILRISPTAPRYAAHRFQHIYAFVLYSLGTLSWIFAKDYIQFFQNKIDNYTNRKHPIEEYFYLFFYKIINYTLFIALPLFVLPYAWYHILAGFVIMHLIAGTYLAIIFMLAHAVEEVHFPLPDDDGLVQEDWMIHQLQTSANFSSTSRITGLLTGGLNTQIEHHLFANICSVHYRKIAPIVKKTCQEFGVPYYEFPTFWSAIASHYRFLKTMGKQESYEPVTPHIGSRDLIVS